MLNFIKLLFDCVWSLFSIPWPGFNFPIGYAFLGVGFSVVVLKLCGLVLGVGIGSSMTGAVSSYQRAARISSSRKDDEK